jgi:eukaryotic-like serine/threonine-protein kinase
VTWLPGDVLEHLRSVCDEPDLTGTRYRLRGEIGRGGMGTVYRVEDTALGRDVAMKVMEPDDQEFAAAEGRVLAQLEHPGIVAVHDAGTLPDGRQFYTMRLITGHRLDHIRESASLAVRLRVFARVCDAVAFAHSHGVLHRDLKPENIMVGTFGEALVLDWGVAQRTGQTSAPAVVGTREYMAPEQARASSPVTAAADVYSLGRILRFLAEDPAPRRLAAIAGKASAAAPEDRYESVPALLRDLEAYVDGLPVQAYRERWWERAGRLLLRHRTPVLLVAAYLTARMIVFFYVQR